MSTKKTYKSLFQSAVSQFVSERDSAVSKINRIINCDKYDPSLEEDLIEEIRNLKDAQMNIQVAQNEMARLEQQQKQEQQEEGVSKKEKVNSQKKKDNS